MKNLILISIFIFSYSCKAQIQIHSIHDNPIGEINNAYYKDVDNFYNQYVGTWVLANGTTYLKVTFKKKYMFFKTYANINYYMDYLVGEYEYKENGVTKVNTLSNIDINHSDIFKYNLWSYFRVRRNYFPVCSTCAQDDMRLVMDFQELPTRGSSWAASAEFILRRVVENGVEKLNVQFVMKEPAGKIPDALSSDNAYQGFSLPFGDYVLTKQ